MAKIESWENRSGAPANDPNAFGYVYFSNGSRVGFSAGTGDGVWEPRTNGGGKFVAVSPAQLRAAREFLRKQGVQV